MIKAFYVVNESILVNATDIDTQCIYICDECSERPSGLLT